MKKSDKVILGIIRYLASDERTRILIADNDEWLETKLSEIKRLSGMISCFPFEPVDWDSPLVKEIMADCVDGSGKDGEEVRDG